MKRTLAMLILSAVIVAGQVEPGEARVTRFVVERSTPYADGRTFGAVGTFVRLEGTVHMEVDPDDPLNAVIVNMDRAPRNARGLVEFSAPFVIIRPTDFARGNQKILYGINNRGNAIEIPFQTFPTLPTGADAELGDGLFFRLGYTFVDAGWAGDIVTTATRLGATLPVAMQADGSPVVSRIRVEYPSTPTGRPVGDGIVSYSLPLKGNDRFVSYETADTETVNSTLTVRDRIDGIRQMVPSDRWAFATCANGEEALVPSTRDICVFDGFAWDKVYELIYPAKNPWVMGLGYAVTRDLGSFLKYGTVDDHGTANPLGTGSTAPEVRQVYGLGISSTGMYLREFVYLGFNEDEAHRRVFDAVRIHIPGTHRLFANVEFADPNIYSRQDRTPDFTSHSWAPLTYAVTTDPTTGIRDGILKRPETDPVVFHIDTSNEFWQMKASLNVHDAIGNPVPIPPTVRFYLLSSHPHGGASGVGRRPSGLGECRNITNTYRSSAPAMRALLVALDAWVDQGVVPPESQYPDPRRGTLGAVEEVARTFPRIPGVEFPTVINGLSALNFGPLFGPRGGRQTLLPPTRGAQYQALVPTVDEDGHDVAGIRSIDVAVPVGTNTGWNLYAEGPRGRDLCGLTGSFFPLVMTRAERLATGDPRLSLEERYSDHAGFVAAVKQAVADSIARRHLLEEDGALLIQMAEESQILR